MVTGPSLPAAPVPLRVAYDHRLGGRWTSLTGGGRQWLWTGPDSGRDQVLPGDPFVDAGGLEECVPTVRGTPDHGDAWSRPWRLTDPATATVDCPDFTLTRTLTDEGGVVVADYRLRAAAGYRFVWAAHALLDLGPEARLVAPAGTPTRLYPEAAELVRPTVSDGPGALPDDGGWPAGRPWHTAAWPEPAGLPLDRLGPDDGTAVGAVLVGCAEVRVVDGTDTLTLRLDCVDQPRSTAVWRNLRGWPADRPYRSIGVEPMLGSVFDRSEGGPGVADRSEAGAGVFDGAEAGAGADVAVVPAGGEVNWRLTISAHRSSSAH
ncbi:hypothetical protein [Micromonospora sp. NPDC004704]